MAVEDKPEVEHSDDQYGRHLYERYLKKREIAEILGTSTRSIENLMARRVIPFTRVGGQPRFRLKDVERALERYTVKEVSL
jgi:excisionase family DNA binding protein